MPWRALKTILKKDCLTYLNLPAILGSNFAKQIRCLDFRFKFLTPAISIYCSIVANVGDISDVDDVRTLQGTTPTVSTPASTAKTDDDDDDVTPAERILLGLPGSSSDDDSDSGEEAGSKPVRKLQRSNLMKKDQVDRFLFVHLTIASHQRP